ncbi:PHP domain-containing protein [Biomaibacter acetigenes]|uniref:PHP domain-containing protein n=1 Tax=Biomaibacter acetigenes TaxID=2316383 RepID=UPI001CA42A07|nr:PHP domain-containing protein [Biomaibacter acetigenes]
MRYDCDLHCHTIRSDGNDSPEELIENATKAGLKVIAITDHDIQPPLYIDTCDGRIDIKVFAAKKSIDLVLDMNFRVTLTWMMYTSWDTGWTGKARC